MLFAGQPGPVVSQLSVRRESTIAMAPRPKLFHPVHGYVIQPTQDLKTTKRNQRERNRVKTVNDGFEVLRSHIPSAKAAKKMSKVIILSHAVEYIQHLQSMLNHINQVPPLSPCQQFTPSHPPPLTPAFSPSHPAYSKHGESGYDTDYTLPSPAISRNNSWNQWEHSQMSPAPSHYPQMSPAPSQYSQLSPAPCQSHWDNSQMSPHHLNSNWTHSQISPAPSQWNQSQMCISPQSQSSYSPISPPGSTLGTNDGESSGEEDDILDAIAEWQDEN